MATSITVNGSTYNDGPYDASTNPNGLANGGWRVNSKFITMLLDTLADATTTLRTTSSASLTIGTGPTSPFTLAQDVPFAAGDFVLITDTSAPATNWMAGQITDRTNDDLTVNVTLTAGSGTLSSWTVQISAPPGETGNTGAAGADGQGLDVNSAANHASVNPTVANTLYFESDTGRAKIGDGSTAYSALTYIDAMDDANTFAISSAHNPSSGTITVDMSALDEIKDIRPTGNDTIDFTNVSASNSTLFRIRVTNGGVHTLSWEINSVAATSVTMQESFTFTSAGEDDCIVEIDEGQNITIARWRAGI